MSRSVAVFLFRAQIILIKYFLVMAWTGSAVVSLLIFGFLCNLSIIRLVGAEDVCQNRKVQHLVTFLEEDDIKKMEGQIESKAMLEQIIQFNNESKLNLSASLKHQEKIEIVLTDVKEILNEVQLQIKGIATSLVQVQDQVLKNADAIKVVQEQGLKNPDEIKATKDCQKYAHFRSQLSGIDNEKDQFFSVLGRIFHYNTTTKLNWNDTKEYCPQKGMQIPMLKTLNDMKPVTEHLKSRGKGSSGFWLTASDIGQAPGHMHWADGTSIDNSLWESGQQSRSSSGKETCLYLYPNENKLYNNVACEPHDNVFILCEVPASLASCV